MVLSVSHNVALGLFYKVISEKMHFFMLLNWIYGEDCFSLDSDMFFSPVMCFGKLLSTAIRYVRLCSGPG